MTPEAIILSAILSVVTSVIAAMLVMKYNTVIQDHIVDRSYGLRERIRLALEGQNNEVVLLFYLGRIWFKITICYFVALMSIFFGTLCYSSIYTHPALSIYTIPAATIFGLLFGYKISQISRLYNAERVAKDIIKKEKGLTVFETNVFWRGDED